MGVSFSKFFCGEFRLVSSKKHGREHFSFFFHPCVTCLEATSTPQPCNRQEISFAVFLSCDLSPRESLLLAGCFERDCFRLIALGDGLLLVQLLLKRLLWDGCTKKISLKRKITLKQLLLDDCFWLIVLGDGCCDSVALKRSLSNRWLFWDSRAGTVALVRLLWDGRSGTAALCSG